MYNRYKEARIKVNSDNKVRYFKPSLYPDIEEKDSVKAQSQVNEMCKKLLANQIIEDFYISKTE